MVQSVKEAAVSWSSQEKIMASPPPKEVENLRAEDTCALRPGGTEKLARF